MNLYRSAKLRTDDLPMSYENVQLVLSAILLNFAGIVSTTASTKLPVVEVDVVKRDQVWQQGVGIIVADDTLLVSLGLVKYGNQLLITSFDGTTQLQGSISDQSSETGLALLAVPGLQIPTGADLELAQQSSEPGRNVTLLGRLSQGHKGRVQSILPPDEKYSISRLQHTALHGDDELGAPVVNNCNELLGMSLNEQRSLFDRRLHNATDFGVATDLENLKQFLSDTGITLPVAVDRCLSVDKQLAGANTKIEEKAAEVLHLREERERLLAEKIKIEKQKKQLANLSEQQKQALTKKEKAIEEQEAALKKEQAAAQIAQAKALEEEKRRLAKEAELQKAQLREDQQKQKQLEILAACAAILVLLAGIVWWRLRRRKLQIKSSEEAFEQSEKQRALEQAKASVMQAELARSKLEFNDIVLVGTDESSKEHRIKIDGNNLIRSPDGLLLGRSAQSVQVVVNIEQVSRQHARIQIREDIIWIEDLGSFNGTFVNGEKLVQGTPKPLKNEDELVIAAFKSRVYVLGSKE